MMAGQSYFKGKYSDVSESAEYSITVDICSTMRADIAVVVIRMTVRKYRR